jgi:histidyl-tRNA synthetase
MNARAALILGDDEIAKGIITLRNLDDGSQQDVALDDVATQLQTLA